MASVWGSQGSRLLDLQGRACRSSAHAGADGPSQTAFERLLHAQNDLDLFSEEYVARAGRLAGYIPQALGHLARVRTVIRFEGTASNRQERHEG